MGIKILVVDDDPDIAELIRINLVDSGYQVQVCSDGRQGLAEGVSGNYGLIILDLMLPVMNGNDICKAIREKDRTTPILMLTIKSELVDKVLGLELGADDYMTKPFGIQELIARVRALLRRVDVRKDGGGRNDLDEIIERDDLKIDLVKRRVYRGTQEIVLTPKEFDLLAYLASSPGRAFSRQELLSYIWGYDSSGYEHTIDTHVNRLRSKIEVKASEPRYVLTVWGVGYRFNDEIK